MPLAKGYSLVELTITLSISSVLLLSVSTILIGLHQQTISELKKVQLLIQAQKINEFVRAEFSRTGFAVSEAVQTLPNQIGVSYLGRDGYERTAVHFDGSKLKMCQDTQADFVPVISVCDEVTNFSMLNDKLIAVDSFQVTQVTSHAVHLEYGLRIKGETEVHSQSLLLAPNGVTPSD